MSVNWDRDSTSGVVALESRLILKLPEKIVLEPDAVRDEEAIFVPDAETEELSIIPVGLEMPPFVMLEAATEVGDEVEVFDRLKSEPPLA